MITRDNITERKKQRILKKLSIIIANEYSILFDLADSDRYHDFSCKSCDNYHDYSF